jgi:hypothetical protein
MYMGKAGVYEGNVEIIALSEICKIYVSVYSVSNGQINQPLTVTANQIVTERNI